MDAFNFLNKKYSSQHSQHNLHVSVNNSQSLAQSRTSKTSIIHGHQYSSKIGQSPKHVNQLNPSASGTQLVANYCQTHSQQLIRHMCLDCVQMLCSECVGDHIEAHKESRTFPTISTLKQIKSDMHIKLSQIMQLMFEEKNHPKNINSDIDRIRQESCERLESLRKQMIQAVTQWIDDLRNSVVNNVGFEQIQVIKQEMYGLHQQVNSLNNCLAQNNMNVQAIRKAYQIDTDKLKNTYKHMADKYRSLSDTMKIQIDFNQQNFKGAIQKSIQVKVGTKNNHQIIKVDDYESQSGLDEAYQMAQNLVNPSSRNQLPPEIQQIENISDTQINQTPILYNLPSGSNIIALYNFSIKQPHLQQYNLPVSSYPLNSVSILPNNMLLVSGGMISQDQKNKKVHIIDYTSNEVYNQFEMKYGRSSHKTVVYKDKVYIVGGFCSETSQCKIVEIITGEGIQIAKNQCRWGGPNLSIIHRNKLMKITLTGVECMNLQSLQWQQLLSDVPFALSKQMQIQKLRGSIYIFGDGSSYYRWNQQYKKFNQYQSQLQLNNICSSTVYNDKIYAWINSKDIIQFDGKNWRWLD